MPSEMISIKATAGHSLSGALEMPTGLLRGVALFAHCFTCTKQSKGAVAMSRALAREGIACLRFDFTGLGASEGEFGRAGFASDVDDLIAAAGALRDRFDSKLLLIGHSLGGAAVLAAAARLGRGKVAAVATIGAPSDVPHVLHNIDGDLDAIREHGEGRVAIGGRAFTLSRTFLEKTEGTSLVTELENLRVPLMVMHAPTDDIVGIEHAGTLFAAAKHPKSFVSLAGADHLLSNSADADFVASVIAGWAARYMPQNNREPLPETGVISRTGYGKFGTEIHTSSHAFIADEPREYGGEDSGPNPYDFLLAALGSCTAMTMKMYAERKQFPLEGASVHVTHERDHQRDCDHCVEEGEVAQIQALHRTIALTGDQLTAEQKEKIVAIADRCPVHLTLEGHLHIHTNIDAG